MFQDDGVARHEGRHHAVDRDQVRIVPGGDGEHHAQRFTSHETREVFLRPDVDVAERLRRDLDHMTRAFESAAHFVRRVARRPPHLPSQLCGNLLALGFEGIAEPVQNRGAIRDGDFAPRALRHACAIQRHIDVGGARQRALDVNAVIDG
jgi:hypothetical protein